MDTPAMYKTFTHPGTRKENQDALTFCTREENTAARNLNRGDLFVVADGMGGHRAGREAARKVCEWLVDGYFSDKLNVDPASPESVETALGDLLSQVNTRLEQEGREEPDCQGWGCTVSALVVLDDRFAFCHAGDTRIYHIRDGRAELITEDQNVAFMMFKHGQITKEEYQEGYGSNKLLSYVGQGKGISVLAGSGECAAGDIFLLCSDGLNQFADAEGIDALAGELPPEAGVLTRLEWLYSRLSDDIVDVKAARDNVTFMLVGVGPIDESEA